MTGWPAITGLGLGGPAGWDHCWVIISVAYLLVRCLLGCLTVLPGARRPRTPSSWCSGTRTLSCAARSVGSATSRAPTSSSPQIWGHRDRRRIYGYSRLRFGDRACAAVTVAGTRDRVL